MFQKIVSIYFLLFFSVISFAKTYPEKKIRIGMTYNGRTYDPHRHTDSSTLAITKKCVKPLALAMGI